jgi:hypothetical protein
MVENQKPKWTARKAIQLFGRIIGALVTFVGVWSFFTNSKTPFEVILGGVSMNYTPLIIFGIGVTLLIWNTPKSEIIHVFKFLRRAPMSSILLALVIVFLVCWGNSQSLKNSRLAGELSLATNPPAIFSNINSSQISLSDDDFNRISENAKRFAEAFTKKNGYQPKIILSLWSSSKNSNHLVRQILNAAKGWAVEIHGDVVQNMPGSAIWIYSHDSSSNPSDTYTFWLTNLNELPIDVRGGEIDSNLDNSGATIVINDPSYYPDKQ